MSETNSANVEPLSTAVLFLAFNRPETTKQVFHAIREAKPPRLYVAVDGPRDDREDESDKVELVKKIATSVDWPCDVKTLFRSTNLGCKCAVSEAITWFFEHEEKGIILEDDCLPHQDFFRFCENMLEYFEHNQLVAMITGVNFQNGRNRGTGSYYFSKYNHIWGWASWRRAWNLYEREIPFWPSWKNSDDWKGKFPDKVERSYWASIFDRTFNGEIDTWDYSWVASIWFNDGLTVTPNKNLVSNIGFGPDATHTTNRKNSSAANPTEELGKLIHPNSFLQDHEADRYVFDHEMDGRKSRFPLYIYYVPRKLIASFYRKVSNLLT